MKAEMDEIISYCQVCFSESHKYCFRDNYKEALELCVIFLGETLPHEKHFTMKAPGAIHHARWLAKLLYSFKIALLRGQLEKINIPFFNKDMLLLSDITDLASFFNLYNVKS